VQRALNSNVACGDRNALNSSVCKSTYWYTVLFTKGIAECFPDCVRSARRGNITACVAGGTQALAITIKEDTGTMLLIAKKTQQQNKKTNKKTPTNHGAGETKKET